MASTDVTRLSHHCVYGGRFVPPYGVKRSRFMKWLSKIFKGSSRGASNGRTPRVIGEESMAWHAPSQPLGERSKADNNELGHAISLPSADDVQRPNGCKSQADTDEELAQAIQNSLMPSFPSHLPRPFYPGGYKICGGCNNGIGYGHYLSCLGSFWHPQCFRCHACKHLISEPEFSMSGSDPYHKSCYRELYHPKCDVCHQFIPTNRNGLIEYRAHPFWGQKYCPSHECDNTPRCCSCERMESRRTRYMSLVDGRSLCLECLDSAVMDTGDCQPLYHAIRDYYEGMNMKLDQQIPMLLVERQALNEAMEGEKDGHRHMPETRGLCLSEEQTVSSIHRKHRNGGHRLLSHPQKLTRKCEVTAILVLYGLPRLLTGSILAHELMHGWLRLKGYRNLNPEVEEGICQVLSHMWLESEVMSGLRSRPSRFPVTSPSSSSSSSSSSTLNKKGETSTTEKKLGEFFMHQIVHDASPAYGEGFRAANLAVNKYGLRRTLDHIRLTGSLPV